MKLIMLGIDGLSYPVVEKLGLPVMKELFKENFREIQLKPEHALSATMWNTIFSGLPPEVHGINTYVLQEGGKKRLLRYKDIKMRERFVWETAKKEGFRVAVLGALIVLPPFFYPEDLAVPLEDKGVAIEPRKCIVNMHMILQKAREVLERIRPDLLVICIDALDRIQHFHYGEKVCDDAYRTCDRALSFLLEWKSEYGIMAFSDHGFRAISDEMILKSNPSLKGDHAPVMVYAGPVGIERPEEIRDAALEILRKK